MDTICKLLCDSKCKLPDGQVLQFNKKKYYINSQHHSSTLLFIYNIYKTYSFISQNKEVEITDNFVAFDSAF